MHFLAVSQYREDAEGAVRAYVGHRCSVAILDQGEVLLNEATMLGITEDDVRLL